ncbi:MAG TPA: type I methionyl aminopeptidase [bacterium]|nr:type I methionyl aminopeptidase [bacterium]
MISLREAWEIEKLRQSARLLAAAFHEVEKHIAPGVPTETLDTLADEAIRSGGGLPAFKGYNGFPASVCTSLNAVVVHGIPGKEELKPGDILSLDIGVLLDGYFSDAAKTYAIGAVDETKKRLMETTRKALHRGIKKCREGMRLSDISHAIQATAEADHFSVVRALVGHGIGTALHEEPQIPNYGAPGQGPKLQAGMVLAIEPMINAGTHSVEILKDGWTVVTRDREPSAHFEHTVLVTQGKPEILTMGIEERQPE